MIKEYNHVPLVAAFIFFKKQNQSISSHQLLAIAPIARVVRLRKCQQCAGCRSDGKTYSSDKEKTVQQMERKL